MDKRKQRLQAFASLIWYEETIRFLFKFISITSQLLLGIGLVLSTVNFLTDGTLMNTNSHLAIAWAWVQALAIDSSLGVTFSIVFQSLKEREWLKMSLYGVLTLVLALVAAIITNIDTSSHALHISMMAATTQTGLNVHLLIGLRSLAVISFMIIAPLKDVSFKDLYISVGTKPQQKLARMLQANDPERAQEQGVSGNKMTSMNSAANGAAQLIQVPLTRAEQQGRTMTEEQRLLLVDLLVPHGTIPDAGVRSSSSDSKDGIIQAQMELDGTALSKDVERTVELEPEARVSNGTEDAEKVVALEPGADVEIHVAREPFQPVPPASEDVEKVVDLEPLKNALGTVEEVERINGRSDDEPGKPEEKIAHAFQQLERERKRISARALASYSHIHRSTCSTWLGVHHPDLVRPAPFVSKKRKIQGSLKDGSSSVQKKAVSLKEKRLNTLGSPSKSGSDLERVEHRSMKNGSDPEYMEHRDTESGAKESGVVDSTLPSNIESIFHRNNFLNKEDKFEFESMPVEEVNILPTNSWSGSNEALISETLKYMELLEGTQYVDEAVIHQDQKEWAFNGYKAIIRQNSDLARLSMVNTLMQYFFPDDKYEKPKSLGGWFNKTFKLYARQKNPLKPTAEIVIWAKSSYSLKQIASELRQERDRQERELQLAGPLAGQLQRPWPDGATRYDYLEADPLQDETVIHNDVAETGVQQATDLPHPPLDLQVANESRNASFPKHVSIVAHEVSNPQEIEQISSSYSNMATLYNTEERPFSWKKLQDADWWADRLKRYLDPKDDGWVEVLGPLRGGYFVVALHSRAEGTAPDILVNGSEVQKHFVRPGQT